MAELVKVTLEKDWGKRKAGTTLSVDPVRAAWLKSNGYIEAVKKRERVSKSKKD